MNQETESKSDGFRNRTVNLFELTRGTPISDLKVTGWNGVEIERRKGRKANRNSHYPGKVLFFNKTEKREKSEMFSLHVEIG